MGTASHAARGLTTRDLAWADVIAVMDPNHLDTIKRHWPHHAEKVMASSFRTKSSGRRWRQRSVSYWSTGIVACQPDVGSPW